MIIKGLIFVCRVNSKQRFNKDLIIRLGHWNKILNAVNKQGTKIGAVSNPGFSPGPSGSLPAVASAPAVPSLSSTANQSTVQSQGELLPVVCTNPAPSTPPAGWLAAFQSKVNNIVKPAATGSTHIYNESSLIDEFRKQNTAQVVQAYKYSDLNQREAQLIYEHFSSKGMEFSKQFQDHMASHNSAFYKKYGEPTVGIMDNFTQSQKLEDPFAEQRSLGEHPVVCYNDVETKAKIMLQLTTKNPIVVAKTSTGEEFQVEVVNLSKNKRVDGNVGEQNVVAMKIISSSDALPAKVDLAGKYQSDSSKALARLAILEVDKSRTYTLENPVDKTISQKTGTVVTTINKDNNNNFQQTTDILD